MRFATDDDGNDGVQYDTFHAPDPAQLEAEAIRREISGDECTDTQCPVWH